MSTYESVFSILGLEAWCESGTKESSGPVSMADLLAQAQGGAANLDAFQTAPSQTLRNRAQPVDLLCRPRSGLGDVERG